MSISADNSMVLEPCPFCGPRDELSGEWPQLFECSSAYTTEWSVRCGCCGIELGGEDREEVLRLWNTRPRATGGDELVERLRTVTPRHDGVELLMVALCRKAADVIETTANKDGLVEALVKARARLAVYAGRCPGHTSNEVKVEAWLAEIDRALAAHRGGQAKGDPHADNGN